MDGRTRSKKNNFTPRPIRLSQNNLLNKYKVIHKGDIDAVKCKKLTKKYDKARTKHINVEKALKAEQSWKRDQSLFSICTKDPAPIFKSKSLKRTTGGKIKKGKVEMEKWRNGKRWLLFL